MCCLLWKWKRTFCSVFSGTNKVRWLGQDSLLTLSWNSMNARCLTSEANCLRHWFPKGSVTGWGEKGSKETEASWVTVYGSINKGYFRRGAWSGLSIHLLSPWWVKQQGCGKSFGGISHFPIYAQPSVFLKPLFSMLVPVLGDDTPRLLVFAGLFLPYPVCAGHHLSLSALSQTAIPFLFLTLGQRNEKKTTCSGWNVFIHSQLTFKLYLIPFIQFDERKARPFK